MDKKYGVYICEGCGIGEALDIEKLCEVPKERLALGTLREFLPCRYGGSRRGSGGERMAPQLPADEEHRLREIERGQPLTRGEVDEVRAMIEIDVTHPVIFPTEQERQLGLF